MMFNLFNKKRLPDIAKKWLPYFYQFNIREKHFWLEKDNLREKFKRNPYSMQKKYGTEPTDGDVIWSMFNAVMQTRKKDQETGNVMIQASQFLWDDGKIDAAKRMSLEGSLMQMRGIVDYVGIVACHDSCKECKSINDKVFLLEEARKKFVLPNKKCTHENGCRCVYKSIQHQYHHYHQIHQLKLYFHLHLEILNGPDLTG